MKINNVNRVGISKFVGGSLVLGLFVSSQLFGAGFSFSKVDVSGDVLGGISVFTQDNETKTMAKRSGFDYAANIDIDFTFTPEFSGLVQLQTSPGGGALGFPGPGSEATDITLFYTPLSQPYSVTLGSFDTPFGLSTSTLSNNADTSGSAFVVNDAMYSAFAGAMGTLNTIGAMTTLATEADELTIMVSNGTGESASNPDGTFEYLLSGSTTRLHDAVTVGGSYMTSNDSKREATGFGVDFRGWLVDLTVDLGSLGSKAFYFGKLTYGDNVSGTKDDVSVWMASYTYDQQGWSLGGRVSGFYPDARAGTGSTTHIPNAGFGVEDAGKTVPTDQTLLRYQVAHTLKLAPQVAFKSEVVYDVYGKTDHDVVGVNGFINVHF